MSGKHGVDSIRRIFPKLVRSGDLIASRSLRKEALESLMHVHLLDGSIARVHSKKIETIARCILIGHSGTILLELSGG